MSPANKRAALGAILLAGAAIRIVYLIQHRQNPFFEPSILDQSHYHFWALEFLKGKWVQDTAYFGLPLYPLWLAAIYKVTNTSILAAKAAQIALGVVNIGLVYAIAQKLFKDVRVSLVAAGLAAVYKPIVFHEVMHLPEALGVPLYTAALLLTLIAWQTPAVVTVFAAALVTALAGLTKSGVFLFVPVFALFILLRKTEPVARKLKLAAVYLGITLLTVAPVTMHNWLASQDFVPLTWHGGLNFYIGNNPQANGLYMTPPGIRSNIPGQIADSRLIAEREMRRALKPSEVSDFWFRKGWEYMRAHPANTVKVWFRKAGLLVNHIEVTDVDSIKLASEYSPLLKFLLLDFSWLWALAFPGFVWGLARIELRLRWITAAWVLCYLTGILAFFVNARYRLPMIPVLFLFAAFAVVDLTDKIRAQRGAACGLWFIAAACAFASTQIHLTDANLAVQYTNIGNVHMNARRAEKAIEAYKQAIQVNPSYAKAYQDLGVTYQLMGNLTEAEHYLRLALDRAPNDPYAYNNLGLLLDRAQKFGEAEALFRRAVQMQPNFPEALNNLGMVLGKQQRWKEAELSFLQSLQINPSYTRALNNLALTYYTQGDAPHAKAYWQRALAADPNSEDAKKGLKALSDMGF